MPTIGGFAAWTERAKDVLVQQLRSHFSLTQGQATSNALKEQVQIAKFGLAGQTSADSYVQVSTALPHENQRIPTVAIMSAPGTEKKMGIGRQVIHTYHDETTGKPMIREVVGGEMTVVIEISSTDTNMRSELTDIVYTFFTMYAEETAFSFLGDTLPDVTTSVPNNYQLILKSTAVLQGETQQNRPDGEGFEMIYFNRITIPILFLDYVDREGFDIQTCYNPNLQPEDDAQFQARFDVLPLDEPKNWTFVNSDGFEVASGVSGINGISTTKWAICLTPTSIVERITDTAKTIRGVGSAQLSGTTVDELQAGALVNRISPGVLSGRLRARFRLENENSVLVLSAMHQDINPLISGCYQLVVKAGSPSRLAIIKGNLATGVYTPLGEGSRVVIPSGIDLAAQFEWKIDTKKQRIRLRGYVSVCDSAEFGALQKRLEFFDNTNAYLTSKGEGVGFRENPDSSGPVLVTIDDVGVITEIGGIVNTNPAKVG